MTLNGHVSMHVLLDVVSVLPTCLTYLIVLTFNMLEHAVRSVEVHQWILLQGIANNGAVLHLHTSSALYP